MITTNSMYQLTDSVAVMESRKSKLTTLLAKLNGEILTSEIPRAAAGMPLSPPHLKRRRISEFSSLMEAGRLGIGSPKKVVASERRAVSGMVRLTEEVEMPGISGTIDAAAELVTTRASRILVVRGRVE